ncbi:hypothetical protein C8R47DRAFT_1322269 [Mycena vitilis]|nr:hypothetical protein C8R47DRAFT_1322269 [Mycena vitilis]
MLLLGKGWALGILLVWALMGSIVIQVYDYANKYRHTDKTAIRALVYSVFLIEIVHTFMVTHTCWAMIMANWGDITSLVTPPWSSSSTPLLNGVVATQVQLYFSCTIETGAVTAGFALITLILFKVFPNNYYFLTTEFILGKMYSNVLLATLNGRSRLDNGINRPDVGHQRDQREGNTVPHIVSNGTIVFATEMNTFSPARRAGTRVANFESEIVNNRN